MAPIRDSAERCPSQNCFRNRLQQKLVLALSRVVGYTHNMQVLHSDKRRRVTLPAPAQPGDSWISEAIPPNQILLTRVVKPAPARAKLVREGRLVLGASKRDITWEETQKAIEETL